MQKCNQNFRKNRNGNPVGVPRLPRNLFVGVGAHDDPFRNVPNSPDII